MRKTAGGTFQDGVMMAQDGDDEMREDINFKGADGGFYSVVWCTHRVMDTFRASYKLPACIHKMEP